MLDFKVMMDGWEKSSKNVCAEREKRKKNIYDIAKYEWL